MPILKTYARLFVTDLDQSLPLLERLVGQPADLRFPFEDVELAAVGAFPVTAGPQRASIATAARLDRSSSLI